MKRVLLAVTVAVVLAAAPVAAQTRVSVAVGLRVPRPYVTGVVIVGRPRVYDVPRRSFYRRLVVVRRALLVRHRRYHRHDHYEYDCDDH